MAIDPISNVVYWADTMGKKLYVKSLQDSTVQPQVLINLPEQRPAGIAVDVCGRYYNVFNMLCFVWHHYDALQILNSCIHVVHGVIIRYQLIRILLKQHELNVYGSNGTSLVS